MKLLLTTTIVLAMIIATAGISGSGTVDAQKYSDQFKQQYNKADHPCLESGNPDLGTIVVQVLSDEDEEGASMEECLDYVDILVEQYGYEVFSYYPYESCDCHLWTLN